MESPHNSQKQTCVCVCVCVCRASPDVCAAVKGKVPPVMYSSFMEDKHAVPPNMTTSERRVIVPAGDSCVCVIDHRWRQTALESEILCNFLLRCWCSPTTSCFFPLMRQDNRRVCVHWFTATARPFADSLVSAFTVWISQTLNCNWN